MPQTTCNLLARDAGHRVGGGAHEWLTWRRSFRGKGKAFLYYFDQHPEHAPGTPEADHGAPHGVDVPYVFENLETMGRPATDGDRQISGAMAKHWTNFAKHGDPNGAGLSAWPAFSDSGPAVMYFADTPKTGTVPSESSLRVLDGYFAWRRSPEGAAATGDGEARVAKLLGSGCSTRRGHRAYCARLARQRRVACPHSGLLG